MKRNTKFALAALGMIALGGAIAFGLTRSRPDRLVDMAAVVNFADDPKGASVAVRGRGLANFKLDSSLSWAFGAKTLPAEKIKKGDELIAKFEDWTLKAQISPKNDTPGWMARNDLNTKLHLLAFTQLKPEELKALAEEQHLTLEPVAFDDESATEKDRVTPFGKIDNLYLGTMFRSGKTLVLGATTAAEIDEMAQRIKKLPADEKLPAFPGKKADSITARVHIEPAFYKAFMEDLAYSADQSSYAPAPALTLNQMPKAAQELKVPYDLFYDLSFKDDELRLSAEATEESMKNSPYPLADAKAPTFDYFGKGELVAALGLSNPALPSTLSATDMLGPTLARDVNNVLHMIGVTWGEVVAMLQGQNTAAITLNDTSRPSVVLRSEKLPAGLMSSLRMASAFVLKPSETEEVNSPSFKGLTSTMPFFMDEIPVALGTDKAGASILMMGDPLTLENVKNPLGAAMSQVYVNFPLLWKSLDNMPNIQNSWRAVLAENDTDYSLSDLLFSLKQFTMNGGVKDATITLQTLPKDQQPKTEAPFKGELTLPEPEQPVKQD